MPRFLRNFIMFFRGFLLDFSGVLWYHIGVKLYFGFLAFSNFFERFFPFYFYFIFPVCKTKFLGKIIFIFRYAFGQMLRLGCFRQVYDG